MRIKIPLPQSEPHYQAELPIQIGDLNYGNHLGNDRLLLLAHEIRLRYFQSIEQTELDFFSHSLIMTDSAIQYLAQGHWGDILNANIWIQPVNDMRFDLFYELILKAKTSQEKNQTLALIKTGLAFFDYTNQKVTKGTQAYFSYIDGLNAI